jgi:hypothetical protein
VRLILAVEGDLKPNAASGIENGIERGWLDFAVIRYPNNFVECTIRLTEAIKMPALIGRLASQRRRPRSTNQLCPAATSLAGRIPKAVRELT